MNKETQVKIRKLKKTLKEDSNVFTDKLPLAIGINKVIVELYPDYSKRVIRFTLSRHCNNKKYLVNMLEGNSRYNFDGTENGIVTAQQANIAKNMLNGKYLSEQAKFKKKAEWVETLKEEEKLKEDEPKKEIVKPKKKVIKAKKPIIKLKKRRVIKPNK
jgi:sRNA-binding protein